MTQSLEPATNAVGRFQFVAANSALRNALLRITAIPNFRRSSPPSPPAAPIPNDHGRQISPLARRQAGTPRAAALGVPVPSGRRPMTRRCATGTPMRSIPPSLDASSPQSCGPPAFLNSFPSRSAPGDALRTHATSPPSRSSRECQRRKLSPPSSVPSPTPRLSWGLARRLVRIRCGNRSRHHDRPRRDGHIRFAADRDCDRTVSRTGASPRRPNCCPADVGHRQRCRGRHMGGLVASRRSSVIAAHRGPAARAGRQAACDGVDTTSYSCKRRIK